MPDGAAFYELVSGRRSGVLASVARGGLRLAEWPYTLAVDWRNHRYDRGTAEIYRVGVPVVSVGNLTLGGTGKTPTVKWLARWFAERNVRLGIVSRGYGAARGGKNDEALELEQALPGMPHLQNPDRVTGARMAIEQYGCELILLDDGFQHRRLARELDIVLLDATEPFGYGHVFPRGSLREPVSGLRRAAVVCLSRADRVSAEERAAIRGRVAELAPDAAWCELAFAADGLINAVGERRALSSLSGKRVAAFCGIGNPAAFRPGPKCGFELVWWRAFPDHHRYGPADMADIEAAAVASGANSLLCTQKDLVKLPMERIGSLPLWAVAIETRILAGRHDLEMALIKVLPTDKYIPTQDTSPPTT